jgi:nucleoid-associated protein YgaU
VASPTHRKEPPMAIPNPFKKDEKKKADFSNVQSDSSSTAPSTGSTDPGFTRYEVKAGDSLSKIAQREYGDPQLWRVIYNANKELIGDDPDLIHPGQDLKIPTQH